MQISNTEIIIRIASAIICGALVGWERESREKSAGLRTHIFVSMGAALAMIVSSFGFADALEKGSAVLDPSRIAAQVVSGIGFLGAGVIWFTRNKVRGLDTAAGIWATSGVGLAAGSGMYIPAYVVTGAVLLMNISLKPIEQRLFPRRKECTLLLHVSGQNAIDEVRSLVSMNGLKVRALRVTKGETDSTIGLDLSGPKGTNWLDFVGDLQSLVEVSTITFNEPSEIE
jgi:putative Mg2+ transporter-C (MgtC) family protein